MLGINPAELLAGKTLKNRWEVSHIIPPKKGGTGGTFSVCYEGKDLSNNNKVFIKALNLNAARMLGPDLLANVRFLIDAFSFESEVLKKCRDSKMRRVLVPVDQGEEVFNHLSGFNTAFYLVFEFAIGDIRTIKNSLDHFDAVMCFRSMHNAALGIQELHKCSIFHQDIKPSNLVSTKPLEFKISDLGNSHDVGIKSPWDKTVFSGDQTYAPIECFFSRATEKTTECRRAYDMYMLGGLLFYHFLDISPTTGVYHFISEERLPIDGNDFELSLPSLLHAYSKLIEQLRLAVREKLPKLEEPIVEIARNMCHPDPQKRGDPISRSNLHESNYSLERFISRFAMLAEKAKVL